MTSATRISSPSTEADLRGAPTRLKREIEQQWPLLTYHYGFSIDELARTPRNIREIYWSALPRIMAQEKLAALEVASFPHMKDGPRRQLVRRLERVARVRRAEPQKPKSLEDERRALAGMGIPVTVVDAEGREVS